MGQQCYPSHFPRKNKGNGDRGPSGPPGDGGLYPHRSDARCAGCHSGPGDGYGGPLDDPYGCDSDSSSSEFGR